MTVRTNFGSGVRMQWGFDQCAVVGIGRLFFQLTSGCN
jgi:hypothetical protein